MLPQNVQEELIRRLRRIEGQAQGIQRMLADGRTCQEVLNQLASVRAATRAVGVELMRHHMAVCLDESSEAGAREHADEVIEMFMRL